MGEFVVPILIVALMWVGGVIAGIALSQDNDAKLKDACKRQHNVYECAAIYVPVTPDGQPLDMSDPFHGEDE